MERITWLVLGYQVPIQPSKKRVYVWRKLREIGATYFKQGVAMLPKSAGNLTRFQALAIKIREMDGDATIAELRFIDPQDETRAIAEFRQQSKKEYQKAFAEIRQIYSQSPETPEQAQTLDEKSRLLSRKLAQIKARDYFMLHREPEITLGFDTLLRDMSAATSKLREHLVAFIKEF